MIQGPAHVVSRVALIRTRLDALAGGPPGRGGGTVGSAPPGGRGAAVSGAAPAPTAAAVSSAVPGTAVRGSTAPGWQGRLPAAGAAWADEIGAAAQRHGVRPELLAALVWTESDFDQGAVSPAGARGLGQLMPGTAAGLGVDPDDPEQNLDGAARYLREQLDRFGDTTLALAAYNAGPGRVIDAGGVPAITETRNYVQRVTERARTIGGAQ